METIKFDLTATMAIIRKTDSNETYYIGAVEGIVR